jgi:hypothetical protein
MGGLKLGRVAVLGAAVAVFVGAMPAGAQVPPPPSPEAADVAGCLCLRQALDRLGADMSARQSGYEASRAEVAALDAQLHSARASLNVDDPQAVAQFRQVLERRDAAFRRSSGTAAAEYSGVVERYNARANEYNARCADRPRNPVLLGQVQATLTCPPPPY